MRRFRREQRPPSMFRGAELMRLMTGILMLIVIVMLMVRLRDPAMWRWFARDDGPAAPAGVVVAPKKTPKPDEPLPAATGPTDEDSDQAEEARQEFQAVTDGTLQVQREEMEPYDRLIVWVKSQSFDRLYRRATKGLRYTKLYDEAEKRRGELVALNVDVRIAEDAGENRDGVPLVAAWAATDESRGRLYSLIVVDYPSAMPKGFDIRAKAKFAGYFLKLQGYEPGSAKPGQRPEKAPLLIGRLEWDPTPVVIPPTDNTHELVWGLVLGGVIGFVLLVRWVIFRWFRPKRPPISDSAAGGAIPVDEWLDRSDFGPNDDGIDGG